MPNCILQIIPPFFLHNDVEPARQTAEAYRAWPILAPCFSHVCFGLFVCPCDLVFSSLLSLIDYRHPPPKKNTVCLFSNPDTFIYNCFCLFRMFRIKGSDYSNLFSHFFLLFCEIMFLWQSNFYLVSSVAFHVISQPQLNASQTTTQTPPRGVWEAWTKLIALPVTKTLEITQTHIPHYENDTDGGIVKTDQIFFLYIRESWTILLEKLLRLVY